MPPVPSLSHVFAPAVGVLIVTVIGVCIPDIHAAGQTSIIPRLDDPRTSSFQLRDTAIKEALVSISKGNLPPNDDRLVALIAENIMEIAVEARDPAVGIEAAGRRAQEAVSELTAAYTAVIFQSSSIADAQRYLKRYQDTVDKIVEFAKNGNFVVRRHSTAPAEPQRTYETNV